MSVKDKQRLAIAIGLVVVVALLFYWLVLRKPQAGEEVGIPGMGSEVVGGRVPGAPTRPAAGPSAAAPVTPAPTGPAPSAPVTALAAASAVKPIEEPRADPFAALFRVRPTLPPPPPLAATQVGIPPVIAQLLPLDIIIPEQEQRRTAGVLWDHQVYAIYVNETDNTVAVVQPGDTVDGETVRAISPQGLVLAVKGGEEVEVPLRARSASATQARARAAAAEQSAANGSPL